MERLKTFYAWERPRFKANNIAEVLASRDLFVDSYAQWYEERRQAKDLPIMFGPVHPSSKSVGAVELPLVGHDPKRDTPESFIDLITFALDKITIFDPSGEMITHLYGSDRVSRIFQPLPEVGEPDLPTNSVLKGTIWTSGVRLNYDFGKRFGRPTSNYYLEAITNPNLSGGKPILTEETALRQAGFGLRK